MTERVKALVMIAFVALTPLGGVAALLLVVR